MRAQKAREYFNKNDAAASLLMHTQNPIGHEEDHYQGGSEIMKTGIFGALDGVITIFCFLSAGHGGGLALNSIMFLGLGNLVGDAISMAVSEYISSQNEEDFHDAELRRESWEMKNCPDAEIDEMIEIYQSRYSFNRSDAELLVSIQWKYPEYFLHNMMVEELGILIDQESLSVIKKAIIMFTSFLIFGSIPLLSYSLFMTFFADSLAKYAFGISSTVSALTVFVLGAIAASFSNGEKIKNGAKMMFGAVLAGGSAFVIGGLASSAAMMYS